MKKLAIIASFVASSAAAQQTIDLKCEDASAFYYYSMFSSQMLGDISGACAKDISQSACLTFMKSTMKYGEYLDLAKTGDMDAFLNLMKASCPDHFPDDPTKFPDKQ
ncbi:hypothetical protein JF540_22955 [Salipiger thiooxidans]|uniref:hypothetical protein n=1 Tax=Salipiger thiooxidans TaxID=282683 RepID=UPI001A8EC789|nr:hypothetical protein [Salipiger thiooxidans]MBN8189549.1 hypothetical protein [Salipiger thiooxidans]